MSEREILFRGKRMDNGEWVYRSPFEPYSEWYQIEPSTVSQYTGLKGKNGQRIFDGDIVKFDFGEDTIGVQCAIVEYDIKRHGFLVKPIYDWMYAELQDCEVCGNIHDNPNLLEVTGDGA